MKVLALAQNIQQLKRETFASYALVRAYYILRELRRLGVEVVECDPGPKHMTIDEAQDYYDIQATFPTADHCLAFNSNFISSRTYNAHEVTRPMYREFVGVSPLYDSLRSRISGCIAVLRESAARSGMEDTVFSESPVVTTEKTVHVGMAADGEVFCPCQSDEVVVLIDHPNYADPAVRPDDDTTLLIQSFMGKATVKIFAPSGIETLDASSPVERGRYRSYLPHLMIAPAVNEAHVFCVTHWEHTPLSVFEAAMAGALIVARRGYLLPWIVDSLRCVEYDERPDWDTVRKAIDPATCRRMALQFDRYDEIARLIYYHFESWRGATKF